MNASNRPVRPAPAQPAHRTAQAEAWEALTLIAHRPPRATLRSPIVAPPATPITLDAADDLPAD